MVRGDRLTVLKTLGILLAFVGVTVTYMESLNLASRDYLIGDTVVLASGRPAGAEGRDDQGTRAEHSPVPPLDLVDALQPALVLHP